MKKSILTPLQGACEYTTYAYDEWGALTNTVYSDGTPTVSVRNDALGRQVGAHDAAGVTTFAYDVYGANTNETVVGVAGTNVLERFTDAYGRDVGYALNGERRTALFRDPATGRIAAMRVAGCTNDFSWTYHPGCDLKRTLRYPNGALVTWEYEPQRDLMTLVSNDVYSSFRYTYDVAGRRVSKNDEHYFYNARGELTLATNVVTGTEFAYRYDDIGNRLWSREFGTNCTYAANGLNQYTDVVRGGVSERTAFDLDGNQTNVVTATGEWAVEYNGENRPVRWTRTSDGATVLMAYDRMGRRVMKDDETFVYDGYLNVSQTVWDPTEPVATRPLAFDKTNLVFLFHDANKNVVNDVTKLGSYEKDYTPYGHCFVEEIVSPWGFSSEFHDSSDSLYFNYRVLSSRCGRWSSRDPLKESIGADVYGFCRNRTLDKFDSRGLWVIYGNEYSDDSVVMGTKVTRLDSAKHTLVGYSLETDGGVLIPLPAGGVGYVRQHCACSCQTYNAVITQTSVCKHFVRKVEFGGSEPCLGSYSGSYLEDRGWRGGVETKTDYKTLGTYTISVAPPKNIQTPYECHVPCLLACQGQATDPSPSEPTVDCSGL